MNLHIVSDNKLVDGFCRNLDDLGLRSNNKVIVRTNREKLKFARPDLPFAVLGSPEFEALVGDTFAYDNVFFHLFSPMMYQWTARHHFKKVSWLVWGADIYDLPFVDFEFYEKETLNKYVRSRFSAVDLLYRLKIRFMNLFFKNTACGKIDRIFTWMNSEYDFIKANMPVPQAKHEFFFYENDLPFQALDKISAEKRNETDSLRIIIGNAGSATLNHIDAVDRLVRDGVMADLIIPVSYGDPQYIQFLQKELASYPNGKVTFITEFMKFEQYVFFLASADALIMNNIRPQGYGNSLIMMYMGKPVFFNEKNISVADLTLNGITTTPWSEIKKVRSNTRTNKAAIAKLFAHDRLEKIYLDLFS